MFIICNAIFMIVLTFVLLREYEVLQSYHYELKRYLLNMKFNKKKYYYFLYCLLGVFLLKFETLYLAMATLLLVYIVKDYKINYTSRIKRVLIINFIVLTILLVTNTLKYVFIVPFLYLLLLHALSLLLEKMILKGYLKKAKNKIKGKYVIGITGSCGKTSIKNILYDLMIDKFNVVKTPKSYNNKVGIIKSINDYVDKYSEYFICEYGVDKVRGMNKLLKIVKPRIAIVSEIGNQHLLTFKSVENILKEKVKLIEEISDDGVGIINNDNDLLRNYNYKNKNILRYGINYDSDVMGKNISLFSNHSEFDLYIKNTYITRISTSLLSIHGVENLLCGICVCLSLDMSIEEILKNVKNVSPIEHRLELKYIDNIEIIDDSFNSNIKGFEDALNVLNKSEKYRIIITPGIIEQGDNNFNISKQLAYSMMNKVDYVCLVSDNSKNIKKIFDEENYTLYSNFDSFTKAFEFAKSIDKEKIILIENDLPNIYLK